MPGGAAPVGEPTVGEAPVGEKPVGSAAPEAGPPGPGGLGKWAVAPKGGPAAWVAATAAAGYLLATLRQAGGWGALPGALDAWRLLHVVLGAAAVALGAVAFGRLVEAGPAAGAGRGAGRPGPRWWGEPLPVFALGWVLAAAGTIQLALQAGGLAAGLAAAALAVHVFGYTPLKRVSPANTLVGAVPGAVPPVVGWVAAGGPHGWEAWSLAGLLFFWQLPHAVAVNWLRRGEPGRAGHRTWADGDASGQRSAVLAAVFALALALFPVVPWLLGTRNVAWLVGGVVLGLAMVVLAARFRRRGTPAAAARLVACTLVYLPLALALLALGRC